MGEKLTVSEEREAVANELLIMTGQTHTQRWQFLQFCSGFGIPCPELSTYKRRLAAYLFFHSCIGIAQVCFFSDLVAFVSCDVLKVQLMANVSVSKPAKRLTGKSSFRLGLPLLCGRSDVASPGAAAPRSSSSSSSRRSSGTGSSRKSELRRIFQHFDRDNDGKISGAELSAFFASMGDDLTVPSSSSGEGYLLDFAGFVALMERGEGSQEEDLKRAFEVFNAVDQPAGRITARGLRRVLAQLGDDRSVADCEAMIRAYDVDGDGGLDFHEFQRMMS
ncbi:putative calcium-binding protein CML41 [Hordeum vulgare]|nr:putative calcium-binding protein CML41 [Hordeum vulgare]